jgi:hypothetical protein
MGRVREYCLYPDMYHGDNKAKIDPYILRNCARRDALHLEARRCRGVGLLVLCGAVACVAGGSGDTAEGIGSPGRSCICCRRTATAHALPVDNFFEGWRRSSRAEGRPSGCIPRWRVLAREYKGLEGYAPLCWAQTTWTVTAGLRSGWAGKPCRGAIDRASGRPFRGDKDRSIALQLVAAEESTRSWRISSTP